MFLDTAFRNVDYEVLSPLDQATVTPNEIPSEMKFRPFCQCHPRYLRFSIVRETYIEEREKLVDGWVDLRTVPNKAIPAYVKEPTVKRTRGTDVKEGHW